MGGNALKKVETRRCNRNEFDDLVKELFSILKPKFKAIEVPRFYRSKQSFGDIDIIVSMEGFTGNLRDFITNEFSPNEIFHNGSCWSFDYKGVQIDLITTSKEHFQSTLNYMSDNDLGNLIGRIAHGFGLKYGQEGLWLEHQFRGQNIGSILLSKDLKTILEFLDLSYERYVEGFDTLEEIFEFISKSRFFNWEMFQLHELNKINRDRNKKRASYMLFLEWIDKQRFDAGRNWNYQFEKDKSKYLDWIEASFPEADLEIEIRRLEYETCKELYMKAKFNGKMVMDFGFTGKDIGILMNGFKDYLNDLDGYERTILEEDKGFILSKFEDYLNTLNNELED
jgi:hypothetical protein